MKKSLLGILGVLAVQSATAAVTPGDVTNAVVGEAAGDPYIVKLGIAAACYNRGTLHGVYGFHARHNATEPAWVWREAARAAAEGRRHDITHGANHFGNAEDVRKGTFAGMTLTVVLGEGKHKTYFFKA
jgi:hypothetical protein